MKNFLESLVLSIVAVFAPVKGVMVTAGVLVFADLIFGVLAARKRKEPIVSSGLRRTVTKTLVYQVAIMLGYLTETYLLGGILPIAKIIGGLIGAVELKSVLESLDELNGAPVFASIITKLGSNNDQNGNKPK